MGPEKLCLLLLFGWTAGSKPSDLCNLKSQQRGVTSSRLGGVRALMTSVRLVCALCPPTFFRIPPVRLFLTGNARQPFSLDRQPDISRSDGLWKVQI